MQTGKQMAQKDLKRIAKRDAKKVKDDAKAKARGTKKRASRAARLVQEQMMLAKLNDRDRKKIASLEGKIRDREARSAQLGKMDVSEPLDLE